MEGLRSKRKSHTRRPGPDAENRHDRRRQKNRLLEKPNSRPANDLNLVKSEQNT